MRTLTAVACLLILVGFADIARGDILLVPSQYPTIQAAVEAANYGDEIQIAAGVYDDVTHMANPPSDSTLCVVVMRPGIKLRGAGIGSTIIDADSTGRGIYLRLCQDVEIHNMTIRRAFAETHGAGIYCYDQSSPYIHHVEITSNYDGGIAMTAGEHGGCDPIIEHCIITDNEAKAGGGLDVGPNCAPYVYDCQINNNRAPFAAGVRLRGSATLSECQIDGNATTSATNVVGGGLLVKDQAFPVIRFCEITNNTVFGDGGGICFEDAGGELLRCIVSGNTSTGLEGRGGGIAVLSGASPRIAGCLVTENSTTGSFSDGGGLWVQYSNLEMEATTLNGNWTEGVQPDYGRAGNIGLAMSLFITEDIQIERCIATGATQGAGIFLELFGGEEPQIDCCDVWNNAGGDEIPVAGVGNFSMDPLFCDPPGGNFYVAGGSPCAAGNHPGGPGTCNDMGIGAYPDGCDTGVEELPIAANGLKLRSAPNPFDGHTTISFELPQSTQVSLEVFDLTGRPIALLHEGALGAGPHQVAWDGRMSSGERVPGGVYFYQLRAGGEVQGRQVLYVR